MNRKGDAPLILTILIAVILSSMALWVFITSNSQFRESSQQLDDSSVNLEFFQHYIIEEAKYIFSDSLSSCVSCSLDNLKGKLLEVSIKKDKKIENTGNFFGRLRNEDFSLDFKDSVYYFRINDVFVKSGEGKSEITKTFNICLSFDSKGEFVSKC